MQQTELAALDIDAPLPTPKNRKPLRLRLSKMRITGEHGVAEIACDNTGKDEVEYDDGLFRKAYVISAAHHGMFSVGHGVDDRSAAEALFANVKEAERRSRRAPKNSARAAHKRKVRAEQTRAIIDVSADRERIIICVSDVLTKNDRYARGSHGTFEKTLAKRFKAAVALAAAGAGYNPPVHTKEIKRGPNKRPASTVFGAMTATAGLWSLEVLSVWPTGRHHADGTDTAHGDADAPLSMVQDSLQKAGIIDDDMRIVETSARTTYSKDERRTVSVLRRIGAATHADEVERLLEYEAIAKQAAAC